MKITARKVAQDLGLSTATVSLAINNRPGVNEDTRQKVLDYMKKLREPSASSHTDGRSIKLINYIQEENRYRATIFDMTQEEYARICRILQQEGMDLKLYYAYTTQEFAGFVLDSETDDTAGMILSLDEAPKDILEHIPQGKVPITIGDAPLPVGRKNCTAVNLHDYQALGSAMDYLRDCGHEKVLYCYNAEDVYNFKMRRRAFCSYMEEWKRERADSYMFQVGRVHEDRGTRLEEYLKAMDTLPDAILTENFSVTQVVMRVLEKLNIQVPRQISVMGIDNPALYYFTDLDYTCIEMPILERNETMVRRLLERMQGSQESSQEILLGTSLKIGSTVLDKRSGGPESI